MAAASSVGIMGDCFFVGRNELLSWINGLLGLNLTKIEAVRRRSAPRHGGVRGVLPADGGASGTRACCGARRAPEAVPGPVPVAGPAGVAVRMR